MNQGAANGVENKKAGRKVKEEMRKRREEAVTQNFIAVSFLVVMLLIGLRVVDGIIGLQPHLEEVSQTVCAIHAICYLLAGGIIAILGRRLLSRSFI